MRLITSGPFKGLWRNAYGVLYMDPPWRQETWGAVNGRAPPYQTMTFDELAALPINDLLAPDCHVFCWTTHPHLAQCIHLFNRWGIVYSTVVFTWLKTNKDGGWWRGMGKTTRKNSELVLLGRFGSPRRYATNLDELVIHPRMAHSVKPEEVRRRIEAYAGPDVRKAELFARRNDRGNGWDFMGDQVGKYNGYAEAD